jgi:hypothetical protein
MEMLPNAFGKLNPKPQSLNPKQIPLTTTQNSKPNRSVMGQLEAWDSALFDSWLCLGFRA